MPVDRIRVYCAGPLFNAKEQEQMRELAEYLEDKGFSTFLPQRDGLELTSVVGELTRKHVAEHVASDIVSKAIFALDVYQVVKECKAIVVNLNGRVPDEGAVSEAAIAWCYGKALVAYKADSRSVFLGRDNPLVAGLFDFRICASCKEVVAELRQALARNRAGVTQTAERAAQLAHYLRLGNRISMALKSEDRVAGVAEVLFEEIAPGHELADGAGQQEAKAI